MAKKTHKAARGGPEAKVDVLPNIALNIKYYRSLCGMSQAKLIEESGVGHIKLIETGRRRDCRTPTLAKIAEALSRQLGYEVTVDDLHAKPVHAPSADDVDASLKEFIASKEGRAATPEEIAELRKKTTWPWGKPTVEGWLHAYRWMKAQVKAGQ